MAVVEPQKSIKSVQHLSSFVKYSGKVEKVTILEHMHFADIATYQIESSSSPVQLMSFMGGCTQDNLIKEFEMAKLIHKRTTGPIAYHIINSVNLQTGYKWNKCDATLHYMRGISDEICLEHNLSVIKERSPLRAIDRVTNYLGEQGRSWKVYLTFCIDDALKVCQSKEEFIDYLTVSGFRVDYTNQDILAQKIGEVKAIRLDKLASQFGEEYSKIEIEKQIAENAQRKIPDRLTDPVLNRIMDGAVASAPEIPYMSWKAELLSDLKKSASEWDRYTKWFFKNKKQSQPRFDTADMRQIESLKNAILYTRDTRMLVVRLIVLSVLMLNPRHRIGYKAYKAWRQKKGVPKKPVNYRIFQNINYYRLINAEGKNVTVTITPQQASMLFNQPFFYSAKVYQNGQATVTVKAKDEMTLIKRLGIDPHKYFIEKEVNIQKENYRRLKKSEAESGVKLIYKQVDDQTLELLKASSLDIACFKNGKDNTICFDSRSFDKFSALILAVQDNMINLNTVLGR